MGYRPGEEEEGGYRQNWQGIFNWRNFYGFKSSEKDFLLIVLK